MSAQTLPVRLAATDSALSTGELLNTPTAQRSAKAIARAFEPSEAGISEGAVKSSNNLSSDGSKSSAEVTTTTTKSSDKSGKKHSHSKHRHGSKHEHSGSKHRHRHHHHQHHHRNHKESDTPDSAAPKDKGDKSKRSSKGKSKSSGNSSSKGKSKGHHTGAKDAESKESNGTSKSRGNSTKSKSKIKSRDGGTVSSLVSPRRNGTSSSNIASSGAPVSPATSSSPRVELNAAGSLVARGDVNGSGEALLQSDVPRSFIADEHVTLRVSDGLITFAREDSTKMIYGGRAERIVEQLLQWIVSEPNRQSVFRLVHVFLSCVGKFHRPVQVLDMVLAHWHRATALPADEATRARSSVSLFLGEWLALQYGDLAEGEALRRVEDFLKGVDETFRNAILSKVHQLSHRTPSQNTDLFSGAASGSGYGRLEPGKFGFLDLKPRQIAEQWTLLDMRNFRLISRRDFLLPNVTTSANPAATSLTTQAGSFTPRIGENAWERMLRRAAMFSRWVASEIVQHASLTQRVEVMRRFVLVALAFLELNNFNGVMSVWGGLNGTAVHRLQRTKKALPKKERELWAALASKLSEAQNFGQLRKAMERQAERGEPLVPWFELINKLRNWADNYNDYITQTSAFSSRAGEQPLLNFGKMYIIGEQMLAFDRYQRVNEAVYLGEDGGDASSGSSGDSAAAVRSYLEHLPTFTDDVLWRLSTQCEPDQTGLADTPSSSSLSSASINGGTSTQNVQ